METPFRANSTTCLASPRLPCTQWPLVTRLSGEARRLVEGQARKPKLAVHTLEHWHRRPNEFATSVTVGSTQGAKRNQWNDSESESPVHIIDAGTHIAPVRSWLSECAKPRRLAAMKWTVTLTGPTLLAVHEAREVARAPSLAQLAQRLRLDLANPFARHGE